MEAPTYLNGPKAPAPDEIDAVDLPASSTEPRACDHAEGRHRCPGVFADCA